MFGTPAQEFKETIQQIGFVRRLSKYVERIAALEEKINMFEERTGK